MGFAFGITGRAARRFTPFPTDAPTGPSSREVPSNYVPNSADPLEIRYTSEELHKFFGNRRILDWNTLMHVSVGGKLTNLGEAPPSIGSFVNLRRGRRGKKARIPPVGHTLCMDIGFGDGISPGGHRYCLVVVDSGSRQCWCYGLRDLAGGTIADALLQLFVDMGFPSQDSPIRRILCDFDPKLMRGKARNLLHRKGIRILSSAPYRQSQNGLVESHWGAAVQMARAYLAEAGLPKRFWFWAVRTAFERMNLLPIKVGVDEKGAAKFSTSFEMFYRRPPRPPHPVSLWLCGLLREGHRLGGGQVRASNQVPGPNGTRPGPWPQ